MSCITVESGNIAHEAIKDYINSDVIFAKNFVGQIVLISLKSPLASV